MDKKRVTRWTLMAVPIIVAYIAIRWLLDLVFHGKVEIDNLGEEIISGVLFYIVYTLVLIYTERMNKNN